MPSGPQRAGDSASPAFGGRVNGPLRYGLSPQRGRRRRDASPVTREGISAMARILASGLIIQSSRVVPRKLCLSSLHGDEGLFYCPI